MKKYDVIVIGTGAGNIVTEGALARGLRCAQIEKGVFGGTCLNRGCIPTKVLTTAADRLREIQEAPALGVDPGGPGAIRWDVLSARVWEKIRDNEKLKAFYRRQENLDVYEGTGFFTGEKTIRVEAADGTLSEPMTAGKIIIAVGARTAEPPVKGLAEAGYLTSERFFGDGYPDRPPRRLIILGGGPIACEFAHIFSAAGTEVTLLQRSGRLLTKGDEEVSHELKRAFERLGIRVFTGQTFLEAGIRDGEKFVVTEETATGTRKEYRADEIFAAMGVQSNGDLLHLENTGIQTDRKGWIRTNEFLETSVEGVFAIGDINGRAQLRHKANYEAELLVHNLFGRSADGRDVPPEDVRWARYDLVPAVTFTYPQVAQTGMTEKEAADAGRKLLVSRHYYSQTAKGYALGLAGERKRDGFAKLIVDRETGEMLGFHAIGPEASVLLQPFLNLMNAGETKLEPLEEDIGSELTRRRRSQGLRRVLEPRKVSAIAETMVPHPALSETGIWTYYYLQEEDPEPER